MMKGNDVMVMLTVLRVLHIFGGVAWFALAAAIAFFIAPIALKTGESGFRFLRSLFVHTSIRFLFPTAGLVTVFAGVLLYVVGDAAAHFTRTGNMVLGFGAVVGILAGIHSGAFTSRSMDALRDGIKAELPDANSTLAESSQPQLKMLAARLMTNARVSFALTTVGLLGMSLARYM